MKRHIFRSFPYTRSDDFAAWLSEMAAKGWIFEGFGAGLIFEKGEPQEITYAVNTFLPGSEMDTRPEPQAEEFAEYCHAAGWELVDAKKRFCVFRRVQEDAVPILTEEEMVENAARAERKRILSERGAAPFLAALYGFMIYWQAEMLLFNSIYLLAFLIWCGGAAAGVCRLVSLHSWHRRMKRALDGGEEIYLGTHRTEAGTLEILSRWFLPAAVLLLLFSYLAFVQPAFTWVFIVTFLILGGTVLAINVLRPSRGENWAIQLGVGFLVPFVVLVIALAVIISGDQTATRENVEKYPFTVSDYRTEDTELSNLAGGTTMSPFGQVTECMMSCTTGSDSNYYLYESPYPWVLDLVETRMRAKYDFLPENAETFGVRFGGDSSDSPQVYLIRGNETLLVLREGVLLSEEEGARLTEIVQRAAKG